TIAATISARRGDTRPITGRASNGWRLVALATAATTAAATATAPATAAWGALARLTDGQRATTERLAVERVHCRLRLGIGCHLDECEAARPPGLPIGHDLHFLHLPAVLLEEGSQLRLLALVREVPYVQSLSHSISARATRRNPVRHHRRVS